ncbi:MAG TPA: cupin domain-containing protein [Pseudonocardia sp.]
MPDTEEDRTAMPTPSVRATDAGPPVTLDVDGGRLISGGAVHARLLVAHDHPAYASSFEMTVAPGFDVGAHVHHNGEEMFYVVDGTLDVLCFEPVSRHGDWRNWTAPDGQSFLRGRPGAFMYVPPGVPHAFANPTATPACLFFQSSVEGGHENYFHELAQLLQETRGHPDHDAVRALEHRYETEQLTAMHPGTPGP